MRPASTCTTFPSPSWGHGRTRLRQACIRRFTRRRSPLERTGPMPSRLCATARPPPPRSRTPTARRCYLTDHNCSSPTPLRRRSPRSRHGPRTQEAPPSGTKIDVLFNPNLKTSDIMIPGLAGLILLFVGMVITSLGVVRERQAGTLEQLAVMPIRPRDVFLGKIVPYFLVAAIDLAIVIAVGGALLFVFVTLGMGVLISSVSETQGQAIQLAIMAMLPQVMLSGLIFPLSSMAAGVRWLGYVLPLTYFVDITRAVMLRGASLGSVWAPFVYLALIGLIVTVLATLRFRRFLAPSPRRARTEQVPAVATAGAPK